MRSLWRQAVAATAAKRQRQWSNRILLWQRHQSPAQAQACHLLQVLHREVFPTIACLPAQLAPCRCTMTRSAVNNNSLLHFMRGRESSSWTHASQRH